MKTMAYYKKGESLDNSGLLYQDAIALPLLHIFVNFSSYGIDNCLHIACSVILCGFLLHTKFKIKG